MQDFSQEVYLQTRLMRHLRDADRPYDAYIYRGEFHQKWQPAHLYFSAARNLDWFRFWLKDELDDDPRKLKQYQRWREMQRTWNLRSKAGGAH